MKCWQAVFLYWDSRENLCLAHVDLDRVHCCTVCKTEIFASLLVVAERYLSSYRRSLSAVFAHGPLLPRTSNGMSGPPMPSSWTRTRKCFTFKASYDYIRSMEIIQDNFPILWSLNSITSAKSFFCLVRSYMHKFWWLGCEHLWEATSLPATAPPL